jgi:hypothetical protein
MTDLAWLLRMVNPQLRRQFLRRERARIGVKRI